MKNPHISKFLLMRLGSSVMAALATTTLATQADEDGNSLTPGTTITAASSMAPLPAKSFPTVQASSLNQPAVILAYAQKYGTAVNDVLTGITPDDLGNVYIAGNSMDSEARGFLRKYSPAGTLLWDKTKAVESIDGVTLDDKGNTYIAGSYSTGASLSTRYYVYLEKYDPDGNLLLTKSFRAEPASDPTRMIVNGIATDPSGNNFVIILFERAFWPYQTRQVFIRKYNSSGTAIWEKPAGTSTPYTTRPVLAIDNQGKTYTAINSAFNQRWNTTISQFDTLGDSIWSTSFYATASTFETYVHGITVDPVGNVYVGGITKGNLEGANLGYFDAFVRKYDHTSAILWTRQFGTSANDYVNNLTTDATGDLYVAGSTSGALNIRENRGSFDAIVRKIGGNGDVLQTRQFGTAEFDIANAVRLDVGGNLYVAGHTYGKLGGIKNGGQDVFFRKYTSFQ